jgi:hypothetical protein
MDVRIAPLAEAEQTGRNLLDAMRLPIESLSVPERLNRYYSAQEAAEEREREAARYQKEAEREAWAMNEEARRRIQRFVQGHTDEELAAWRNEQRQTREAKIAELECELGRLKGLPDPDLPVQRSAARPDSAEAQLALDARHAPGREFMRRMVADDDQRRELARSRKAQAELARLEQAANGGAVTRRCDTEFQTYY